MLGASTTWLILRSTATLQMSVGLLAGPAPLAQVVDHVEQGVARGQRDVSRSG
jgi:hypothetical protein